MEDWMKVVGVIVLLIVVFKLSKSSEKFGSATLAPANITTSGPKTRMGVNISDSTALPLTDAMTGLPVPNGCNPPQSIDTDLLPKPCVSGDDNFSEFAPNPSALANQSYLEPGKFNIDSTFGNKRNQSRDLRVDPAIPACPGAWGNIYQSTILPDPYRKNVFNCQGPSSQ